MPEREPKASVLCRRSRVAQPVSSWIPTSHSQSRRISLDLDRSFSVALATARQPREVERDPQASETGWKFPRRQLSLPCRARGSRGRPR